MTRTLRLPALLAALAFVALFGLVTPARSAAATTVASAYGSQLYIDSGTSNPTLEGAYVAYNVTSSTAQSDVWVTIGNFAGGVVSLAPHGVSRVHIGAMAAGATATAFFYLQASAATTTAQTHTITVYNGEPGAGGTQLTSAAESLTVATTIAANANKVTSVTASTATPGLGGTFNVTVQGATGTIGAPPSYYFTPAADVNFPANAFQLTGTSITFNQSGCPSASLNCATFTNTLQIPSASMPSTANTSYTAVYTFKAINTIGTSTGVSPVGYIASGSQVKHTDSSSFSSLPPIAPVTNTMTASLASSPTAVNAINRTVTLTATVSNSGQATSLDDFVATLPTGATYVPGSTTYNGVIIADPALSGQTATWAGQWNVPASVGTTSGTSTLSFQITLPATQGAYTTDLVGHVQSAEIDATLSTSDNTPAGATVNVETTAPTVTLSSTPASLSNNSGAPFAFTADQPSTFQCQIDSGAWTTCASPFTPTGLADGAHTFTVQATDAVGNISTPVSYSWTLDTTAPTVTITSAPATDSPTADATFAFSASETATFACSLDGAAWTTCASPVSYTGLSAGNHTFAVQATDTAGNVSAAASDTWDVDTAAPTVTFTSTPNPISASATGTIGFTADALGATFTCELDGTTATACTSPFAYSGLADGSHTLSVTATSPAGHASTPVSTTWTIDTSVPTVSITAHPADPTNSSAAALTFAADNPADTLTCSLDGAAFTACTSPDGLTGLADGSHTFSVRATNAAGTTSPVASTTWTVDTTAPTVAITGHPDASTTATTAHLTFSSPDSSATLACRVDGGAWSACTSPVDLTGVSIGAHTFDVRATDTAGNTSSPATFSWTVAALPALPAAPAPAAVRSTGTGTAAQATQLTVPSGDTVTLLDGSGTPQTTLTVTGQGTYVVDPATASVSFVPQLGFSGQASPVQYRVTDAYSQTGVATYTPTVVRPAAPAAAPLATTSGAGQTQQTAVTVPTGGTIALVSGTTDTNVIVVPGEGSYTIDPGTGTIGFVPLTGFRGQAHAITYVVTDAYGQRTTASYAAMVTGTPTPTLGQAHVTIPSFTAVRSGAAAVPVTCRTPNVSSARCAIVLTARIGHRTVVIGRRTATVTGGHARLTVSLTRLGRTLIDVVGGTNVTAQVRVQADGQLRTATTSGRIVAHEVRITTPVMFDTDSTGLIPGARAEIAALRHRLAHVVSVICTGAPDSQAGDDRDDFRLGPRRAVAVCAAVRAGHHVPVQLRSVASRIPGDLDQVKPVIGAWITLVY